VDVAISGGQLAADAAVHVSISVPGEAGDLLSLCHLTMNAFPGLPLNDVVMSSNRTLHVDLPWPLLDAPVDPITVREQADALYGSLVRHLQEHEELEPLFPTEESLISRWQYFLEALERDAIERRADGEMWRTAPSGDASVGLLIDATGDGREVHSYSLRGIPVPVEPSLAIDLCGLIAQRLRPHHVLRAGFCDAGTYHFWALVDPAGPQGSTVDDRPAVIRLRAREFAAFVRVRSSRFTHRRQVDPDPSATESLQALPSSAPWYFRQPA
jgi:hypothetical protein